MAFWHMKYTLGASFCTLLDILCNEQGRFQIKSPCRIIDSDVRYNFRILFEVQNLRRNKRW